IVYRISIQVSTRGRVEWKTRAESNGGRHLKIPREEENRIRHKLVFTIDSARVVLPPEVKRIVVRHAARIALVIIVSQESREGVIGIELYPLIGPAGAEGQGAIQR